MKKMSNGLNKVFLIGNLGNNPDIKKSEKGTIANFSVATGSSWKDKNGNKVEHTEWHKIVAFGRPAEIIEQYLTKGSKVHLEGYLRTRKWQDKSGQDKYTVEIVVNQLLMLGGNQEHKQEEEKNPYLQDKEDKPPFNSNPEDRFDDDIPF
jgi:single-strand DNA-binding protein